MGCLHPLGYFYEVPSMLLNGVLGKHLQSGNPFSFEVVARRIEDRGGGLAKIDGKIRPVESFALPREEDELALSYYNSLSCWIDIDQLLEVFKLSREDLLSSSHNRDKLQENIRE